MKVDARRAIFWGGFWCGVLDITSAFVAWGIGFGISPVRILHSVASGSLGREAAQAGGWKTALLGLLFHFVIAFGAAATYYVVSRKLTFLTTHAVICGLIYGEIVYFFMHLVVMPLSAMHTPVANAFVFRPWPSLVTGPIGHPFLVGLPIALAVRKWGNAVDKKR